MRHTEPITLQEFLRYGVVRKFLLKMRDRDRYKSLKHDAWHYGEMQDYCPPPLRGPIEAGGRVASFKHSGNAGDIIYALPALRLLAGEMGAQLCLALDAPRRDLKMKHPLGAVQLNRTMYDMLVPLLERQDYINEVVIYDGSAIDFDLDVFRDAPVRVDKMGICRWYFYLFGVTADLSKPWLEAEPDEAFQDRIVIARSKRYRNLTLSYNFLREHGRPVFVGLREEYDDFRKQVPEAEWVEVKDFHQLARIIAGSRLFIGNQSFPFSLAEALKVPRVLELDPCMPNVVPTGEQAYDVLFQRQFEHVVGHLLKP